MSCKAWGNLDQNYQNYFQLKATGDEPIHYNKGVSPIIML
jgi:hypothetical protein